MDSAREIENLLYPYANRIDRGDLDGVADLLANGRIHPGGLKAEGPPADGAGSFEYEPLADFSTTHNDDHGPQVSWRALAIGGDVVGAILGRWRPTHRVNTSHLNRPARPFDRFGATVNRKISCNATRSTLNATVPPRGTTARCARIDPWTLEAPDYFELTVHAPDGGTQWLGAHAGCPNRFFDFKVEVGID